MSVLKDSWNSRTVEVNFHFWVGHVRDAPTPGLSQEFWDCPRNFGNVSTFIWQPNIRDTDLWPEYILMVGKESNCYKEGLSLFVMHETVCHYKHQLCATDFLCTSYTANIEYIQISCYHALYAKHLKDTSIICIKDLHLLNCVLSSPPSSSDISIRNLVHFNSSNCHDHQHSVCGSAEEKVKEQIVCRLHYKLFCVFYCQKRLHFLDAYSCETWVLYSLMHECCFIIFDKKTLLYQNTCIIEEQLTWVQHFHYHTDKF